MNPFPWPKRAGPKEERGAEGRRRAAQQVPIPLNREQCAQILKRALIIEDVNMCEVRQGRFR